MQKVFKYIDKNLDNFISDLKILIQQPSVSAKNEGIEECALLVKKILMKSGIKSEILRIGKNIAPIVYGEVKSKQNPNKTLLFYNHYDVQPAEPFELWDTEPFVGTVKGNKIFGRESQYERPKTTATGAACRQSHESTDSSAPLGFPAERVQEASVSDADRRTQSERLWRPVVLSI